MRLFPANAKASTPAEPPRYTGEVWTDDLAYGDPPIRVHVARVSFSPGSRTAWHTHPFGQILHIVSGLGLVVRSDGSPICVAAGDTVAIAPGERHWHGATATHAFVHLAIQGADEQERMADWAEPVNERDYQDACAAIEAPRPV